MALLQADVRARVLELPRLRDKVPCQQPVLRQPRPRWLRELPTRVSQVALQTSQGDDQLSRQQGLRPDQERVDHTDEDRAVFSGAVQTEPSAEQEDREGEGRGEGEEAGSVHVGEQLPGTVEAEGCWGAYDEGGGFPSDRGEG